MKKTNRQLAIEWWHTLGNKAKDQFASKKFNRNYATLTGREVELIWFEEVVTKPV